jgi:hypothetical protein
MRDFTIDIYKSLLDSLKSAGYEFVTFFDYMKNNGFGDSKSIILRHDVDDRKMNSLLFAKMQYRKGIKGTYYFRMVPESYDEDVIKEIESMGHEIGYHYEDMDFARGDKDGALKFFEKHLEKLRTIATINTICMHGSPKSEYDNKDVWNKYDYRKYQIKGEPYFDMDFESVYYITDTGRMWDGFKVSVRDKVNTNREWPAYHSTKDLIAAIDNGSFPIQVMMNFHPQRWMNEFPKWFKEWAVQSVKNQVKAQIVKRNTYSKS